ncbi:hypothetical protein N2152v2_006411 [Parachlorella kessleri]
MTAQQGKHLDVAATKALLQRELPVPATPTSPIYLYYLDNENAARFRADDGGLQRSLKNKRDLQAALEGLGVTQVVPLPSTALARTMKPKQPGLETARWQGLSGHVIGASVRAAGPALAQANNDVALAAVDAAHAVVDVADSSAAAARAGAPAAALLLVVPYWWPPPAVSALHAVPATPTRRAPASAQALAPSAAGEAAGGAAAAQEQPAVEAAAAGPRGRAAARAGPVAEPEIKADADMASALAAGPAWQAPCGLRPQQEQTASSGRPAVPAVPTSPAGPGSPASAPGPASPTPSRARHVSGRRLVAARGFQEPLHAAAAATAAAGAVQTAPAPAAGMRQDGRRDPVAVAAPGVTVDLTGEGHSASAGVAVPAAKRQRMFIAID